MDERFLIRINPEVQSVYSSLAIDAEALALFATDPEGPIRLTPEDLAFAPIEIDGRHRLARSGTVQLPRRWGQKNKNEAAGYPRDALVVNVGVEQLGDIAKPEKIEEVLTHELIHVRQIRKKEASRWLGPVVVKICTLTGAEAVPVGVYEGFARGLNWHTNVPLGVILGLLVSAAGAVSGYRVGYWLAPNEREARKLAATTPYRGIITGEPNPDYRNLGQRLRQNRINKAEARQKRRQSVRRK